MYEYDGVPVMSVTQILRHVFPQKYRGIPKSVLDRAADRGNSIHAMIEEYALTHSEDSKYNLIFEGINYELLEKENGILITSCEQMLVYLDDGKPLFAGTYDMHGVMGEDIALFDIKTTSKFDDEYLRWQLGLYSLAYKQMYDQTVQRLGAFWYPKDKVGEFREIYRYSEEKMLEEVMEIVKKHSEQ